MAVPGEPGCAMTASDCYATSSCGNAASVVVTPGVTQLIVQDNPSLPKGALTITT